LLVSFLIILTVQWSAGRQIVTGRE
jgi:hypothetical protein